jgi:hypothetical protein
MTLEVDSSRRWAGARGEGIDDLGDPAPAVEEVGGGLVVGVGDLGLPGGGVVDQRNVIWATSWAIQSPRAPRNRVSASVLTSSTRIWSQ